MPNSEIIQTLGRQVTTEVSRLPPQNTIFLQLLACLAQHPPAFTSRCRTDKAGRGAVEPPPKTALERSDLTEKFQFRASHAEAETTKTPYRIKKKKCHIYIYATIIIFIKRKTTLIATTTEGFRVLPFQAKYHSLLLKMVASRLSNYC